MNRNLTLQTITILSFLTNHIKHGIDQLRPLRVMPLGPVIPGPGLAKHEVIRPEKLAKRARPDRVHSARFKVHEHRAWDVPPAAGLIEINVDPLKLEIGVAAVFPDAVDGMLAAYHLPEFGADLVATLAPLNVQNFSHFFF